MRSMLPMQSFLPIPKNENMVSHPVKERNSGKGNNNTIWTKILNSDIQWFVSVSISCTNIYPEFPKSKVFKHTDSNGNYITVNSPNRSFLGPLL